MFDAAASVSLPTREGGIKYRLEQTRSEWKQALHSTRGPARATGGRAIQQAHERAPGMHSLGARGPSGAVLGVGLKMGFVLLERPRRSSYCKLFDLLGYTYLKAASALIITDATHREAQLLHCP
jgi:hypothetical protein